MREIVKIDERAFFEYFLIEGYERGSKAAEKRPLLLILPGGAYLHVSGRESSPIAVRANAAGFHAAVLNYTVIPQKTDLSLTELTEQVKFCLDRIAADAEQYAIDSDRINVIGFSAGGHLAAWAGNLFPDRIAKLVLAYPAVGFKREEMLKTFEAEGYRKSAEGYSEEEKVWGMSMIRLMSEAPLDALHAQVPPTFLFTTVDDEIVPFTQSVHYGMRLAELSVPCEMHFYEKGGHGLSLANEITASEAGQVLPHVASWFDLAMSWLKGY